MASLAYPTKGKVLWLLLVFNLLAELGSYMDQVILKIDIFQLKPYDLCKPTACFSLREA
jgi:hypothetical protein